MSEKIDLNDLRGEQMMATVRYAQIIERSDRGSSVSYHCPRLAWRAGKRKQPGGDRGNRWGNHHFLVPFA